MKLGLLNAPVLKGVDELYLMQTLTLDEAKKLTQANKDNLEIAVGHKGTAEILENLLDINMLNAITNTDGTIKRPQFFQQAGQSCICFSLLGRIPEGKILTKEEVLEIGFEFKLITEVFQSFQPI